jgi:predicted Zn finger-like uncharacterized protein
MSEVKTTQCPDCKIAYFVTRPQLAAAKGSVRCGICLNIFDANTHATEWHAEGQSYTSTTEIKEKVDVESLADAGPQHSTGRDSAPKQPTPLIVTTDISGDIIDNVAVLYPDQQQLDRLSNTWQTEPVPSATKSSSPEVSNNSKLLTIFLTINILALLGQLLFYYSAELSLDERYRPLVKSICEKAGCPISQRRNINLIHGDALIIGAHPETNGALEIEFILSNRATFPQAFPELLLKFSGLGNNLVAQRTFAPDIYLRGTLANISMMDVQKSYRIKLAIMDPGEEAISYSLTVIK